MTENEENKEDQSNKREFLDPTTTATVGWFVFVEVSKAFIAFFTMKGLRVWWTKKHGKDKETDVGENESYQGISDKAISEEESGKEA